MKKFISVVSNIFTFELFFILFLFAGRYKGDPRFAWIPVDLTALFFGISILGALYVFFAKGFNLRPSALKLNAIYLVFVIYALITYIWTPGEVYAREKMLYISTLNFWSLMAASLIISSNYHRIRRFLILFVVFSCWIAIETFIMYMQSGGLLQLSALGGNYLGIGRVLGPAAIVLLIYGLFFTKSRVEQIAGLVVFGFFLFLLLVAGGRGPLLATIIPMMIPLFTSVNWKEAGIFNIKKTVPLMVSVIGIAVIGMIYLISIEDTPTTLRRLELLWQTSESASLSTRWSYYTTSLEMWVQHPMWGYGVGSWPIIVEYMDIRGYPHNIILETMFEFGLVGLMIMTTLFVYGMKQISWRSLRKNPLLLMVFLIFLNALLNSFISGDIPANRFLFAAFGLLMLDKSVFITSKFKRSLKSQSLK